jgi:hypothetical protein
MARGLQLAHCMSVVRRIGKPSWALLCRAPLTVWLGIASADSIAGSLRKEAQAFEDALVDGTRRFEHNAIVKGVAIQANRPSDSQRHGRSVASPNRLLKSLRRVSMVLDRQCEVHDAEEFRKFLLDFGWTVARASSESPLGGCKVSVQEERFLYQVAHALRDAARADDA